MQQTPEKRLTYEAYYRLANAGALGRGHTELINGEVVYASSISEKECVAVMLAHRELTKLFGGGYVIRPRLQHFARLKTKNLNLTLR